MEGTGFSGGCQCGAVRFHVDRVKRSAICHCRMCQKAFGNYFAPLVMVDGVEWTRGTPAFFRSSNRAQRGFCASCGTPLCYLDDDGSIELAGGAFDDPDAVPPTMQYNVGDRLRLFDTLSAVPPLANVAAQVAANARVLGYQHPDRDTEDDWLNRRRH
jgi:hypothetical protein